MEPRTPETPRERSVPPLRVPLDRPPTASSASAGSEQPTTRSVSLLREPLDQTPTEHSGTPHSSLASPGYDSPTAVQTVSPMYGRYSSTTVQAVPLLQDRGRPTTVKETFAKQIGPTKNAARSYKRDSNGEANEFKAGELRRKRRHTSRGVSTRQQQLLCDAETSDYGSTSFKSAKIAVDPTPSQATSALLIPSTDVSPVAHDKMPIHSKSRTISDNSEPRVISLQGTEVASTDDDEESHLLSCKIDALLLMRLNRHNRSNVLRYPKERPLDELGNRMTKFQATARGYLLRTKPLIREFKKSISARIIVTNVQAYARGYIIRKKIQAHHVAASKIQAVWRGFKTRKFLASTDRETISDEAMEDRFEEAVDEVLLLQEQVDDMQKEIDHYKEKLKTAETVSTKQIEQLTEQVQKLEEAQVEVLSLKDALEQQVKDLEQKAEKEAEARRELEQKAEKEAEARLELERKAKKEAEMRLELERHLKKVQDVTSAAEERIRKLEQMISQAFPHLVVEQHSSGDEPARPSKENRTQLSSSMLSPDKAFGIDPRSRPRSRSRSPLPVSGRVDKRTVLGQATTNVKSTAFRKEH